MELEIKYPETILLKSEGLTEAEKYLGKLCRQSFFKLEPMVSAHH
jgi:hypothetical protein